MGIDQGHCRAALSKELCVVMEGHRSALSRQVALDRNPHWLSTPTEGKAENTAWMQVSGELGLLIACGRSL